MKKKIRKTTKSPKGDLLEQVIQLTGIPTKSIQSELRSIMKRKNIDRNDLTIEQLRRVVASYLREIMSGIMERSLPRKH